MILINLISATVQLIAFTLIPFVVYLITKRTTRGFFFYIGIHRTTYSAITLAVLAGLAVGVAGIIVMCINPEIRRTAAGKGTVPEQIKQLASPTGKLVSILIIAFVKTALAEEILFRGFIAKRLISWMGYQTGNLLQSIIFGAIHVLLFLSIPGVSLAFLTFSFLLPGMSGYLACHFNEKRGKGSIYPGWVMHVLGNLISYAFLVL